MAGKSSEHEHPANVLLEREITVDEGKLLSEHCATTAVSPACLESNAHVWTLAAVTQYCCSFLAGIEVRHLALGGEHCLVVSKDDSLFSRGVNLHGQLGLGDTRDRNQLCLVSQLSGQSLTKIVCGARHSLCVNNNGIVYSWGDSRQGQCGLGDKGIFTTPSRIYFTSLRHSVHASFPPLLPPSPIRITSIASGELFSVAIDSKGVVWSWGTGSALGVDNDYDESLTPQPVKALQHKYALSVACGAFHCLITTLVDMQNHSDDLYNTLPQSASISSQYIKDLKNKSSGNHQSKVPFLQSGFYANSSDDDESGKGNDEECALANSIQFGSISGTATPSERLIETGLSVSELDLRRNHISSSCDADVSRSASCLIQKNSAVPENVASVEMFYSTREMPSSSPTTSSLLSCVESRLVSEVGKLAFQEQSRAFHGYESSDESEQLVGEIDSVVSKFHSRGQNSLGLVSSPDAASLKDVSSCGGSENELFEGKRELFGGSSDIYNREGAVSAMSLVQSSKHYESVTSDTHEHSDLLVGQALTEVWAWGKNSYGQLGLGDVRERLQPTLVEKLVGKSVYRLAAGAYHSLALTSRCKVYSWGDNTFGQLGHAKTIITKPKRIKALWGIRVWDFAAGRNFSLFVGDSKKTDTDVYFCGEAESHKTGRSLSNPVVHVEAPDKRRESRWNLLSQKSKRRPDGDVQSSYVNIDIRKVVHFEKNELIRAVLAEDFSFACITERVSKENGSELEAIIRLAQIDRLFFHQMMIIERILLEPLVLTETWSNISKLPGGDALVPLLDSFADLLNGIGIGLRQLTDTVITASSFRQLFSYVFSDSLRAIYDRYCKCYCNALAVGHVRLCNKPSGGILSKVKSTVRELQQNLGLQSADFETLMMTPLTHIQSYPESAKKIRAHCLGSPEADQLDEVVDRWDTFSKASSDRLALAKSTCKFWDDCHAKIVAALKDPRRRVLKSSKADPLHLARASRMSHSFILCNDVFVHVQFGRNFRVFPLVTLWADSLLDADNAHNAIRITTPEESFVVVAGTPNGKFAWLSELSRSIACCLNASSIYSLDMRGAVNTQSGLLSAAVAREATYVYQNHMNYRLATYSGMWFAGNPHGRGKLSWPDGTCYEGEFRDGHFCGFGVMSWRATTAGSGDKVYQGEWKDGKMFGYGKMRYHNGDEYHGHFKDGIRDGHGTLKSMSPGSQGLNTVYVGDWVNDVRCGYGVLDLLVRGEKYMGMWTNDQRHGNGIVVTTDGIYYEGNFFQNRLVGQGILLSDDDTCYEGDFTADMLLNGKGVLTFANGDFIDGMFFGKWGEGIKVNGTYSKFANQLSSVNGEASNDLGLTSFTIDADLKWTSLFKECLRAMGVESDGAEIDPMVAWRSVRDSMIKAAASVVPRYSSGGGLDPALTTKSDFREVISLENDLKGLQNYLAQAFNQPGHPLNTLVSGLVEVYSATYVGVGAQRRLLPHAVAEAKSYVKRLFSVLRVLFPGLHDEEFVLLSADAADGVADTPINSMSLLHPLVLPRLYPPLFTLYALHTEKTDAVYMERLHYLNKRGDVALMSFLGVDKRFWLHHGEIGQSSADERRPYMSAIRVLEQISTAYSPMAKIDIIRKTVSRIEEEVGEFWAGAKKIMSMDDLFPLFQYIVIRARVPHLGSEIKFIEDMVDPDVLVGEAGHRVTTLSACYFQIQNEKDRD